MSIAGLNVATGIPLYYELDEDLKPLTGRPTSTPRQQRPQSPRWRAKASREMREGPGRNRPGPSRMCVD